MTHDALLQTVRGNPVEAFLLVLVVLDLCLHARDYFRKKLAPRRCRIGFHTCAHCALVLAVHERRETPPHVEGRGVSETELPPGLRTHMEN